MAPCERDTFFVLASMLATSARMARDEGEGVGGGKAEDEDGDDKVSKAYDAVPVSAKCPDPPSLSDVF